MRWKENTWLFFVGENKEGDNVDGDHKELSRDGHSMTDTDPEKKRCCGRSNTDHEYLCIDDNKYTNRFCNPCNNHIIEIAADTNLRIVLFD